VVDGSVDVVLSAAAPGRLLDLSLHGVDDDRHGLDEMAERRTQRRAVLPARQHHAVPVSHM